MARSPEELQTVLAELEGVEAAYFQPPTKMQFPCIKFERDDSFVSHADNVMYWFLKRYQVTVIDRRPDSAIPDLVEALPHTAFDRFDVTDGLNHWTYNLYF